MKSKTPDQARLDRLVAQARQAQDEREAGYRARALAMYPWVCGRCGRTFDRATVAELTVHHRDHNHDNNPPDGSNWELLCLYCHDNEHSRLTDAAYASSDGQSDSPRAEAKHQPFADLQSMLQQKKPGRTEDD